MFKITNRLLVFLKMLVNKLNYFTTFLFVNFILKLSEEQKLRHRNDERIKILTRELEDKEEKLQSAQNNQAANRRETQQHKFAKSDLENQLRDANSKYKQCQSENIKLNGELSTMQERFSNAKSNKEMENGRLEDDNKRLIENLNTLKYESDREAKKFRMEQDTLNRSLKVNHTK